MTDIVERLRVAATHPFNQHGPCEFLTEAADEITRLRAEIERLRAALDAIREATDMGLATSMQGAPYLITNVHTLARAALGEQP